MFIMYVIEYWFIYKRAKENGYRGRRNNFLIKSFE